MVAVEVVATLVALHVFVTVMGRCLSVRLLLSLVVARCLRRVIRFNGYQFVRLACRSLERDRDTDVLWVSSG